MHYKKYFENKVVFCNCDDPFESNFFKYFAFNFNSLKLKKLICTCYTESPIVYEQLSLLDVKPLKIKSVHTDEWGQWDVCDTCNKEREFSYQYFDHYDGEDHVDEW